MPSGSEPIRFGLFEVNLETAEIRRDGTKVRLQEQPFQVLAALLEKPGAIVTKEELQERIWKDDTFVDFDRSLATAINKVRQALGDSATRPQYIETVARRGYRFIGLMPQASPTADAEAAKLAPGEVGIQRRKLLALQIFAAVLGISLLGVLAVQFAREPSIDPEQTVRRFSFVPPQNITDSISKGGLALSPNGRHIAYTTTGPSGALWVQDLDQDEPRELAGTESASSLFWSPDSEFIGFVAEGALRKISVRGGASSLICAVESDFFYEGTWSPSGESIIFSSFANGRSVLLAVSSEGGSPEELVVATELDETASWADRPRFLLGTADQVLLFTVRTPLTTEMYVKNLDSGQTAGLGLGDRPVYSARTGHLIYQSELGANDLWARPFSPETLQFTGAAFPLRQNARSPSVSEDGSLVYLQPAGDNNLALLWVDRSGQVIEDLGLALPWFNIHPALSPDGRSVAYIDGGDVWVQNLSSRRRIKLSDELGTASIPVWSPAGDQVAYSSTESGKVGVFVRARDGSGEAVQLENPAERVWMTDWTRDGHAVLVVADPNTALDVWYQERTAEGFGEPRVYLQTPDSELNARVSPNGRYVAYLSNESDRQEVYVRPFPGGGPKTIISTNGGTASRWGPDGTELFYVENGTLIAVEVSTEGEFAVGAATRLFPLVHESPNANYDISSDGQRFLVSRRPLADGQAASPKIRLVQNWYEEFRDPER